MKIFSLKVLRFTIPYYRTVDLMRTSNTAQKNRCHQEQGRTIPKTWWSPPFSRNVETTVGKYFFKLLKKHFGQNHKYRKIFNKNIIKFTYSCVDNMKKVLTTSTLLPTRIKQIKVFATVEKINAKHLK